jgi:hypothetical protein
MLAPANQKTVARPTRKELEAEASRLLARFPEPPTAKIDGVADEWCPYRLDNGDPLHPNYVVARHTELRGANLWNGVRTQKNARRPCHGWKWVTTFKAYQPEDRDETHEQLARCECPDCSWLPARLLDLHANEVPEPARLRPWSAPQLIKLNAEDELAARLADCFRHGALSLDAFKSIAGWQRFLPGLGKDSDDPVAKVLRTAFWIRDLYEVMSGDDWTVEDVAETCRALHPDGKLLPRRPFIPRSGDRHERDEIVVEPERRRFIIRDEITATRLVINYVYWVLLRHDVAEKRFRASLPAGRYVTSGMIVKLMLEEGRSARDAGLKLGLSGSIVSRHYKAAIATIADSLGLFPWPWRLSSQKRKSARGVERRAERTDKPALSVDDRPVPLPYDLALRALFEIYWLALWAVYYGHPVTLLPPGCANGVIERVRALDTVARADPDDIDSEIIGKVGALKTEGQHVILFAGC